MEEVYDLHQHAYLAFLDLRNTRSKFGCYYSNSKNLNFLGSKEDDTCITYDKEKTNIKSWGKRRDDKDDVYIDNFKYRLYQLFKKDKDKWNGDDRFLLKAVSDFIRLLLENGIQYSKRVIKNTEELHYIFVVPSEWEEEEIRETLFRPIFIQSNLISKNDHNDTLLFCSDLETVFYDLMDEKRFDFEKIRKTIFCRFLCPVSDNKILIKLDLVLTRNYLFDFPDSLLFPKVERSHQLFLTINTFTDGIRDFIKDKLPLAIREEIIQIIMDEKVEKDEEDYLKPLITDTSRWKLDKRQLDFIESICILNICSQICKNTTNNIDVLLSNDTIKEYNFFLRLDLFSSEIHPDKKLLNWSEYLLTYNRTSSRNKNIKFTKNSFRREINPFTILKGASRYGYDVTSNSNIYSRPQILPVKKWSTSAIFRRSIPDAIMNIDISIESTILSFSLLDENGFVQEVWNHVDFLKDKSLRSLGSFFNFSETMTLNVKSSFIEFAEDYLMEDVSFFYIEENDDILLLNLTIIETILCKDKNTVGVLVSTQQQIYIKAFVILYMTYIKYVISRELSDITDYSTEIKIGYNITIEKMLLNRLFRTKEGLKDIIYASGLIQKEDNSKKLRIIAEGERILHLLRRSLALPFPLNSYFVLAQLHENYIQLTLNKVVTESSSDEEDQESIIIHDRIILIPNIYTSLCLNMWNNIVEDSSLIKLCDTHQEHSGDNLLEIFSLQNQAEFTENLKQYMSKDVINNLSNSSSQPATNKINIHLSVSCKCRVYLTVRDIIDISFQPVLQNIVSLVSASFINKELFGKFWNILYSFQLIHFDCNTQLHDSLIKMLKETTEDVIKEQGVDIPHYIIPKSLNPPLQPVLHQQPISYKEFKVGTLHHVYGGSYGFGLKQFDTDLPLVYKNKTTDTKPISVNEKTVFSLFKAEDIINDLPTNFTFYLNSQQKTGKINLSIEYYKLKRYCNLKFDGTILFGDIEENVSKSDFRKFPNEFETGQDVPFMISISYEAYSGSLALIVKLVGQDMGTNKPITLGIPMRLSRF